MFSLHSFCTSVGMLTYFSSCAVSKRTCPLWNNVSGGCVHCALIWMCCTCPVKGCQNSLEALWLCAPAPFVLHAECLSQTTQLGAVSMQDVTEHLGLRPSHSGHVHTADNSCRLKVYCTGLAYWSTCLQWQYSSNLSLTLLCRSSLLLFQLKWMQWHFLRHFAIRANWRYLLVFSQFAVNDSVGPCTACVKPYQ